MRTNNPFLVYLAGAISGLTYDDAEDWRAAVKRDLRIHGIKGLSPLRGKDYLRAIGEIDATGEAYAAMNVVSAPRGVITRDRFDATRCDVLLVNLLGAKKVSIGTMFEVAFADSHRIPIVCVMEESGNVHEHMMLSEMIGYRVTTLTEALHVIRLIADQ